MRNDASVPDDNCWEALLAPAGICRQCRYALLTRTRRGPVYVRCGRAATDPRLRKYPRLPLSECVGFEPLESGVDPV
jgi:hypothetical protein